MPRQIEIARDGRVQSVQQVRDAGNLVARHELARDGGAADLRCGFQHRDLQAGLREIGGGDQAVVAGADDDRVCLILRGHCTTPRLKSFRISCDALAPGAPMTPPPGCVPEPHM